MIRSWQAGLARALLTGGVLALLAPARAQPAALESEAQTGTSPAPATPDHPGFADKATGNWSGARRRLDEVGLSINASLVLEGFKNFQGGLQTADFVGASTFDLNLALDTGKALHWPGGRFYVDLQDHAGQDPSTVLVGDLQVFDKLNSPPYLQVFELWYQQKLLDGRMRLKIGKVDANTEFSVIENGLSFLSSSAQVSPTVFVFPTTPDPMPSVNLFFNPGQSCYAGFGAYYANRSESFGVLTGHPQDVQVTRFGGFFIGETGLRWRRIPLLGAAGNLKLGAWGHTGTFPRLQGGQQQGTQGFYAIFDQTLWQPAGEPEKGRGVRTFLEYGRAQSSVSIIDEHVGGGLSWTGPLAKRPNDITGICAQYAHLSPKAGLPHSYELALEGFYQVQLSKWAVLMPDLQYIVHPGGQYPDALVGTLRLSVQF